MNLTKKNIIAPICDGNLRNGEGSGVLLKDGKILFVYSRFTGCEDHDFAELFGGILDPETATLSETRVFHSNSEALNQISVSLERLQDSAIGMVYAKKTTPQTSVVLFSKSYDEGVAWSSPIVISKCITADYFVVNNDRLRQFSDGRLAVPVCVYPKGYGEKIPSYITLLYSDDNGATWQSSNPVPPCPDAPKSHNITPGFQYWENLKSSAVREQEPGVEELPDGRILIYCRTLLGTMHYGYSLNRGNSWSFLRPVKELSTSCSPQSIRRIPGTTRLLCAYTDHSHVAFGDAARHWGWRTPLSLAVSDDCGASWRTISCLAGEEHNYCYTSILFYRDQVLFSYYQSENTSLDSRRNLAYLKLSVLPVAELTRGVRILFFGSSICAFREDLKIAASVIGDKLRDNAVEHIIFNAGVGGNTTDMALERLQRDVLDRNPDVVIMSLGINDSAIDVWKNATEPRVPIERYAKNLTLMIREMKRYGILVIVFTPPPLMMTPELEKFYGKEPYLSKGFNFLLDEYVRRMREIAVEEGVPIAEVNAKFKEMTGMDAEKFMNYSPDGMHPNDQGQEIIAELLWHEIKQHFHRMK